MQSNIARARDRPWRFRRGWSSYALAQDLTIKDATEMRLNRPKKMQTPASVTQGQQTLTVLDLSSRVAVQISIMTKGKEPLIELRPMWRNSKNNAPETYAPWRYGLIMRIGRADALIKELQRARDIATVLRNGASQ